MHATPLRRRLAGATMALGAVLIGISAFAPSASAGGLTPPFFNTDTDTFDAYLMDPHRGTSADADGFAPDGDCPEDPSVAGLTVWHLVVAPDSFVSGTLDVRLTIDGVGVTLEDLTAADNLTGFDPTASYLQHNNGTQAYVFAGDGDDVLVDAAANTSGDADAEIRLSHICPGADETDTTGGTDAGGSDSVQATTGSQDTGGTDTQVKGNVVEPQQLPATGDNDASLAIIGAALVLIGGGVMLIRRDLASGS